MSDGTDLAVHVRALEGRLDRIEATLLRLEQLMFGHDRPPGETEAVEVGARTEQVRFATPRLRHPEQVADFSMSVTHD